MRRVLALACVWCLALALGIAGATGAGAAGGGAEDPLVAQGGDVLSVTILEDPSLDREAKVDASGRIMLPRVGTIPVAGLGLDQVRDAVAAALKQQDIIREPTVTVEFAGYRQVYVDGAVSKPGAVVFEPGLTVRKAIALAGGLARATDGNGASSEELLKLNASWRASSFAMLEIQSRIARLKAELEGRKEVHPAGPDDSAITAKGASEILALDRELLQGTLDLREKEDVHMRDLLNLTDFLLRVLDEQQKYQETERSLQKSEVEAARALAEKGMIPRVKLNDLEREEARMGRDILEVKAFIARSRQDKETLAYQLDAADQKRKVELEGQLRDAVLERTKLEQEAELLAAQILARGISLTGFEMLEKLEPHLAIHRSGAGGEELKVAEMSTPLRPGDVLEVSYEAPTGLAELGQ